MFSVVTFYFVCIPLSAYAKPFANLNIQCPGCITGIGELTGERQVRVIHHRRYRRHTLAAIVGESSVKGRCHRAEGDAEDEQGPAFHGMIVPRPPSHDPKISVQPMMNTAQSTITWLT